MKMVNDMKGPSTILCFFPGHKICERQKKRSVGGREVRRYEEGKDDEDGDYYCYEGRIED